VLGMFHVRRAMPACMFVLFICAGCGLHRGSLAKKGHDLVKKLPPVAPAETPTELTSQQKDSISLALAQSLERRGEIQQAKHVYNQLLSKDEKCALALHRLAVIHTKDDDAAEAESFYGKALSHDPRNAEIHCDLGYSQYLQDQLPQAEESYRRAIHLQPNLRRAHNNLGMLLARHGRTEEALQEFARAGCGNTEAELNLAFALALAGKREESRSHYESVLKTDPSSKKAREGLACLDSLQNRRPDAIAQTPRVQEGALRR
jgi:Tfp pilus assembly protein PilF